MRKLLILILIALLIALSVYIGLNGFQVGNIEVLGYTGIQQRSDELDGNIQKASKLAETDYKSAVNQLENNAKKLLQEKQKYEDMTLVSSEGDVQSASQLERYELETLWVKLGTYATSEGVVLKMEISSASSGDQDNYDLNFTAVGSYISITDFISDIENDTTLGFKIENFKMVPESEGQLQGTFTCKDIAINGVSQVSSSSSSSSEEETSNDNTTSNTTNTTNTTNTNSTNTSRNTTNTAS